LFWFLGCPPKCESTCDYLSNTLTCHACASGYFGDDCEECSTDCKTCVDLATKCTSCNIGYYLNEFTCTNCDEHCITCANTTGACLSCDDGYVVNEENKCASNYKFL